MSLNPENPRATEREIEALVEYAAQRGHNSQDLATLCALTMGCLIRRHADGDADARRVFDSLMTVAAHHAGVQTVH